MNINQFIPVEELKTAVFNSGLWNEYWLVKSRTFDEFVSIGYCEYVAPCCLDTVCSCKKG